MKLKQLLKTFFSDPVEPIHPNYNLEAVKQDLWQVLQIAPAEAKSVRQAIIQGDVDGGYYIGDCCCIKGIMAKSLGIPVQELNRSYGIGLNRRSYLENFLFNIMEGDTPESNSYSRAILQWCDQFIAEQNALKLRQAVQAGIEEVLASVLPVEDYDRSTSDLLAK